MKRKLDFEICERLRDARKSKKLSLDEASKKIGIAKQTLVDYEGGRGNPTLTTLLAICRVYEVTPNYIAFGNDESAKTLNNLITRKIHFLCSLSVEGDISFDNGLIKIKNKKLKDSFELAYPLTKNESLTKLEIAEKVIAFLDEHLNDY